MTADEARARIVMVMGSPRSGTTWLGKIFDSHPDTIYSHEPDSLRRLEGIPLFIPLTQIDHYRARLISQVPRLREIRNARVVAKLPLFPKSYYSFLRFRARCLLVAGMKVGGKQLGSLNVPDLIDRTKLQGVTWVWKSIESVGRLGILARILPDSRATLIIRHPCGVISSILRGQAGARFGSRLSASEDYEIFNMLSETEAARKRNLTIKRFLTMSPVERLAWRWALVNENALSDTSGLANVQTVLYEDLCADPPGVSKELMAFAGLRWEQQTEQFVHASTERERSSYYAVYKNPLRAAMKWKDELNASEIERILSTVQDTLPGKLFLESRWSV